MHAPIVHEEEKGVCKRINRVGGGGGEGERRRKGRGRRWEAASSPGCAEVTPEKASMNRHKRLCDGWWPHF